MRALGSAAALVAAIHDEAATEVERIERDAASEVARIEREAPASRGDADDRKAAVALAGREAREILAREDARDRRASLEARERWMDEVRRAALRYLSEEAPVTERRAALLRRIAEGMSQLPGNAFDVVLGEADAVLIGSAREPGLRKIVVDAALPPGACVVRSADGRIAFDNGYEARARRFERACRAAVGEVYER